MFPPSSTAFLQTGFRTPEIYTVVIVSVLGLGSNASDVHIIIFYYATAMVVALGAISWIVVARSKPALQYFAEKDANHAAHDQRDHETSSLLSRETTDPFHQQGSGSSAAQRKISIRSNRPQNYLPFFENYLQTGLLPF